MSVKSTDGGLKAERWAGSERRKAAERSQSRIIPGAAGTGAQGKASVDGWQAGMGRWQGLFKRITQHPL